MTDNEIIKALENAKLVINDGDAETLAFFDSLIDFINRQKAEIERLEELLDGSVSSERNTVDNIDYEKTEAIKEFAERLKEHKILLKDGHYLVDAICIDNLVKEMAEENK